MKLIASFFFLSYSWLFGVVSCIISFFIISVLIHQCTRKVKSQHSPCAMKEYSTLCGIFKQLVQLMEESTKKRQSNTFPPSRTRRLSTHSESLCVVYFPLHTWCMCNSCIFNSLSLCVFVHNLYPCREMCERQNAVVYRAHCVYCVHAICYVHVYRNCQFTTVIRPHFVWCSFFYVFVFIQLS